MNNQRALLLLAVLLSAACATSKPAPVPVASVPPPPSQHSLDGDAYRKALEEAYTHIVARETKPLVPPPQVDVEAAISIPIPEHRTINGALAYFTTGLKESIQTSLIRSARYKKLIEKALDEQKLPRGLAYLPVIESAYLPTLTSRAGAHGIWQFMPETARDYGMRVDWWMDERADPERSTRAAAKFLKDLYREFGDWPLVLAAYNCGPGRVRRALADTGSTTFWELLELSAVPKETRGYVPTFFATIMIAGDPETYGFTLAAPTEHDEKRVEVEGPLSLAHVAEVAGVDEDLLRQMNPALRQGMLPPGRAYVRVPSKVAAAVAERATTMRYDDANIAVCSYTLKSRDSLKRIARSIGSSPETILAMNGLDSEKKVRSGKSILLPVRARELGILLRHGTSDVFYAVRKGDTPYSIAKKHNLTVAELLDLNDLKKGQKLRVGMRLRVEAPRTVTAGGM